MTTNSERVIKDHIINPKNDTLEIVALGSPGCGGANHHYEIQGMDCSNNPCMNTGKPHPTITPVVFQCGTIPEYGVNGLTHEVLLAIVADRLCGFQSGKYACKENARALTHTEEAMHWLRQRTLARMHRGVEGTYTP